MTGFVRELLLGPDAVKPVQRATIASYLAAVIEQRGFPLHLASLWNALYFEWDLDEHGYVAATLDPARVETRAFGATDRAVPVGGFVSVKSGDAETWAEVVYKEGRHPEAVPGEEFPAHASGARAQRLGDPPQATITEALVLDWDAFGPHWNDETDLTRLRRRGRLDRFGHLVMNAVYLEGDEALDDGAFFANYLVHAHREGLLGEFVEPGTPDEDLHALLLVSLVAIADIVANARDLVRSAGYVALASDYRATVGNNAAEQSFGSDFFETVIGSLTELPRRQRVGYLTTGGAVLDYLGRGGGIDAGEIELLDGPGYSRLVTYANLFLGEHVRAFKDGLVTLPGGTYHLRRDDPWQWGGVWRSERVVDGVVPAIARIPPLVALGLGAEEGRTGTERAADTAITPAAGGVVELDADTRSWIATLGEGDLDTETLPLGAAERFLGRLAAAPFRLKISIEGRPSDILFNGIVALDPRGRRITGVQWGTYAFAGLRLHCYVERNGMVVRADVRPLAPPEVINGIVYLFEHAGVPGRRAARPLKPDETRRASSLRELIARAFRTLGEPLADGGFRADLRTLAIAIGGTADGAILSLVGAELRAMELPRDEIGRWTWRPAISHSTQTTESTTLGAFKDTAAGQRAARFVKPTSVRMHLRRWDHKSPDTWEERWATYPAALDRFGARGLRVAELPRGFTWVSAYVTGAHADGE